MHKDGNVKKGGKTDIMIDFLYLCDGKNCQDKPQWKAYGCGECKHTTNPEHAKNKHVADIAEGIK